jgi:ketosteroid isomerase-like protein
VAAATEETVREMIDAWNEGNVDRMIDFWVEDGDWIWEDPPDFPGAGVFRGRDAVERHLRETMEILEGQQITIERVDDLGNEAFLIEVSGKVRGAQSGIELEAPGAHVVNFERGRVRRYRFFIDRDQARAAAEQEAKL